LSSREPRIGLFGLLGSGNLGNDGSLEAVLDYLKADHPDAVIDAFCGGPDIVQARYRITATPMHWYRSEYQTASGLKSIVFKGFGKLVDVFRTAAWVRGQDVVIVPGMGVLEATLPLRPWGFPYSLLLLCASGRLTGTKIALVSVGSSYITHRVTRVLVRLAAGFATYRSYRDEGSREAMRAMGVDVSADKVYPDLAFALPVPTDVVPATGTVGVGVMAYYGGNDDRAEGEKIYATYLGKIKQFVRWLVENDRPVRLFIGDQVDNEVVEAIIADAGQERVSAASASTLDELMREMAAVDTIIATRYHNVLCALKLSKPTISIGYAVKNDVLMTEMGLADYCQQIREFDVDVLIKQFTELEGKGTEVRRAMDDQNAAAALELDGQFAVLSETVIALSPIQKELR
jgi:polysaccharide pyruvyl transferase WcaK-like protein